MMRQAEREWPEIDWSSNSSEGELAFIYRENEREQFPEKTFDWTLSLSRLL